MSAYPAFLMGTLCIVGGITGFVRTRAYPPWSQVLALVLFTFGVLTAFETELRTGLRVLLVLLRCCFCLSAYYYGKTVYLLRQ
ncbi:hypothetical protein A0H81_06354 [Grifola frondosa]|uniref:Uncharacterized protein n=1 Tax=Grifola frondosa TaxID=5627 RepID=A0A1C7M9V5_GRIFR|nr:hypothetical protein A0H81_06354 [Grifola frondosa]